MLQHVGHLEEKLVYRKLLVLQGLLAREGEHALGQVGTLVCRFQGSANALGGALVVFHELFHKLKIAHHNHQKVVEIMGNATGQLANRFHLLGLQVFAFEGLALGYALAGAEEGFNLACRIELGLNGALEELYVSRLEAQGNFHTGNVLAKLGEFDAFGEFFLVARLDHVHESCEIGMDDCLFHADEAGHFS